MATEIKANIQSGGTIRANVEVGGTVRVNVTSPATKVTSQITNVVKATIKDIGPQGEKGDTGDQGPQGDQGEQGPGSNIRVYTWVINYPGVGIVPGPKLKEPHTITSIESYVVGGTSATFNVEERTDHQSAGVDILTSDQVADVDGASNSSFANPDIATNSWLTLAISAISGSPEKLTVTVSAVV